MPFEMFPRMWTPIGFSNEVTRARPFGATIAGTHVVAFRDAHGAAHVLLDHCAHRGARLSLGKIRNDVLECPFHGWCYDSAGRCAHVPLGGLPDAARAKIAVGKLAVHEAGGLVFAFTAVDATPDEPAPYVPEDLSRDDVHAAQHGEVWNTHWSRAMENMLDAPHLPFVHRTTIGRGMRKRMKPTSVLDITVEDRPYGFRTTNSLDGNPAEAWLDWLRPNGMVLHIPIPNKIYRQHVYCVPVDDTHTRMMLVTTRNFGVHNPLMKLGDLFSLKVLHEDRRVVESILPKEVPSPKQSHASHMDTATFTFRRWYYEHVKHEPA